MYHEVSCFITYDSIVGNKVSRGHHLQSAGPEPSVDTKWFEVSGITTFDLLVTQTSGSVNVLDIGASHQSGDEILLSPGLQADHVHAHLSAVVTSGEPVPAGISQSRFIACPRGPVTFGVKVEMAN
jgi:hypothetical protein